MRAFLLALVTAVALAASSQAQAPLPPEEFINKAAISNMFGVELGTLALQKSSSPEIKSFAHQAVNDRTTASTGLRQIVAKRTGISLPEAPDAEHRGILRALGDKQGDEFDRAYVAAQMKAQEEVMALFTAYAQDGTDAELKSFATKTLPTLKAQTELARNLPAAK